jgi:hypothetical protein
MSFMFGGAFAGLFAVTPQAFAQQATGDSGTITVQQFMQELLPYGSWMAHPQFGWVWQPHDVQPWWQPFAVGEWTVTQDGAPYWRSGYPFGWATEHYGSWTFDEAKGWLWIPGNDWSAAPVAWRATDGVIGWAPIMATGADVQAVACPQPPMAWIFVPMNRLMTTSNFAVAEQELVSRDAHGTWGNWAHDADGASAHRMPEPSNAGLLDRTKCLGAAEAKDAFLAAVRMRGGAVQGSTIEFVNSRGQMGSGRIRGGNIPAYAPTITGTAPPAGGDFLVNPPAQRVERALPAQRVQRVERTERLDGEVHVAGPVLGVLVPREEQRHVVHVARFGGFPRLVKVVADTVRCGFEEDERAGRGGDRLVHAGHQRFGFFPEPDFGCVEELEGAGPAGGVVACGGDFDL